MAQSDEGEPDGEDEIPEVEVTPEDDPGEGVHPEDSDKREVAGQAATERGDFLSLMGHFYRGAMSCTTTWHSRLDRTSNWCVVVVATLLTWGFSRGDNPNSIILLGMGAVSLFLFIEARRYRTFDVWRWRVRMLEENVLADALEPTGAEQPDWRRLLSEDLRRPAVKIPLSEALARRLRRFHLPLLLILLVAWLVRLLILADGASGLVAEAGVWRVPGSIVLGAVATYYLAVIALAFWPMQRQAKGKMRDREQAPDFSKEAE